MSAAWSSRWGRFPNEEVRPANGNKLSHVRAQTRSLVAYLLFPVIELVPRSVSVPQVSLRPDARLLQPLRKFVAGVIDGLPLIVGGALGDTTRNNNNLDARHPGGKNQALVVAVDHDHDTDGSGTQSPRVLPHEQLLALAGGVVRIFNTDVEHLWSAEVLTKTVRGSGLDTSSCGRDEALDSGGVQATSELLLLRLDTWDNRNGQKILVHSTVEIEDVSNFRVRFSLGQMSSVAFLPQELSGSEERFCSQSK